MKSIFVSSTFRDFQAERDVLRHQVLPELNKQAAEFGESVSFCDLRWGVDTSEQTEEESSRTVLSVCLKEIDRAHPYMIVLIGERYGYMPGANMIGEEIRKHGRFSLKDLEISVTQLEIEYGALSRSQRNDHVYFYFRELKGENIPADYLAENPDAKERLDALKERIRTLFGDRVRFYPARFDGEQVTDLEEFVRIVREDLHKDLEEEWQKQKSQNPFEMARLIQKNYVEEKAAYFLPVKTSGLLDVMKDKELLKRLRCCREKRPEIGGSLEAKNLTGVVAQSVAHQKEARALVNGISQYFLDVNELNLPRLPIELIGGCGSGKTVTMVHTARILEATGCRVIPVFCGVTSLVSHSMGVLAYMIYEMESLMGRPHTIDSGYEDLEEYLTGLELDRCLDYFSELCASYTEDKSLNQKKTLVFLVDGLEKIRQDDTRDHKYFVPDKLNHLVNVIFSEDKDFYDVQRRKALHHSELKELSGLEHEEKRAIIDRLMSVLGKQLPPEVIAELVRKEGAENPLYLNLAILRLTILNAADYATIRAYGDGMPAISRYLKELVVGFPDNNADMGAALLWAAADMISPEILKKAMEYMAVSRHGLRLMDLQNLLEDDGYRLSELTFVQFAHYLSDLFQIRADGRYDFLHDCLREGILGSVEDVEQVHDRLCRYLMTLPVEDAVRRTEAFYHFTKQKNGDLFFPILGSALSLKPSQTQSMMQDLCAWARANKCSLLKLLLETEGHFIIGLKTGTMPEEMEGFREGYQARIAEYSKEQIEQKADNYRKTIHVLSLRLSAELTQSDEDMFIRFWTGCAIPIVRKLTKLYEGTEKEASWKETCSYYCRMDGDTQFMAGERATLREAAELFTAAIGYMNDSTAISAEERQSYVKDLRRKTYQACVQSEEPDLMLRAEELSAEDPEFRMQKDPEQNLAACRERYDKDPSYDNRLLLAEAEIDYGRYCSRNLDKKSLKEAAGYFDSAMRRCFPLLKRGRSPKGTSLYLEAQELRSTNVMKASTGLSPLDWMKQGDELSYLSQVTNFLCTKKRELNSTLMFRQYARSEVTGWEIRRKHQNAEELQRDDYQKDVLEFLQKVYEEDDYDNRYPGFERIYGKALSLRAHQLISQAKDQNHAQEAYDTAKKAVQVVKEAYDRDASQENRKTYAHVSMALARVLMRGSDRNAIEGQKMGSEAARILEQIYRETPCADTLFDWGHLLTDLWTMYRHGEIEDTVHMSKEIYDTIVEIQRMLKEEYKVPKLAAEFGFFRAAANLVGH